MTCSVFLCLALSTGLGYLIGRLRPVRRLERWSWRRLVLGPGRTERPLGWPDIAVHTLLHPLWWARRPPEAERIAHRREL